MDDYVLFLTHGQLDGFDTLTNRAVERTIVARTFVLGIHGELRW
jgi:hypothetical protein